ncbi:MAG: hypothetical protein EOM56_13665 [Deltaproteobacteria bacterium]|nr:hypothetical protein [Deltaproteobacteria bacterium]
MSKALLTRLLALEALHKWQEPPRPAIVAIKAVNGTISASVPGQTEPETFSDEAALEARAEALGMRCILVLVVDGRRGATVQEKAPCAA